MAPDITLTETGTPEMTPGVAHTIAENRDELTADETRQLLEDEIQRHLGMSLDEFYRRAEAGTLPDHPLVAHLALLAGARTGPC